LEQLEKEEREEQERLEEQQGYNPFREQENPGASPIKEGGGSVEE
jgi:hypothetical protein